MDKLQFSSEYFNAKDTLFCGQIFRFKDFQKGYKVFSLDKACYVYTENGFTTIESDDINYFKHFFDLDRDYSLICKKAISYNIDFLSNAVNYGKGVRILNQSPREMFYSFIVSQNNNIPRIKSTIEKLCSLLGEKKSFLGEEYFAFPTDEALASSNIEAFKNLGLGYRAEYILETAYKFFNGYNIDNLKSLNTETLKTELLSFKGVGPKVADCISLFGFGRTDCFPVDVWIEKLYHQDFKGELTDRKKISQYFVEQFKEDSGYVQQYIFYYKRSLEKRG